MAALPPADVSVVVSTRDRARRLRDLLDGLRAQTHPRERFEVVIVDDASGDETSTMLAQELERDDLRLRVIRLDERGGWATGRERGWRASEAQIVAFTDDDCVPDPGWLAAGLAASAANPGAIVQGRTDPIPGEFEALPPMARPFTRTIRVPEADPAFQTCNVFYPRAVLEQVDGFDVEAFRQAPGEDADLAWRAIAAGAGSAFAPEATVKHAVNELGPLGKLRHAAGWDMRVYARHSGLRDAHFYRWGLFWKRTHLWLFRALLVLLLPRRLRPLGVWLALPYVRSVYARGKVDGGGALLYPWYVLYDLVEVVTVVRSAIRYRVPML